MQTFLPYADPELVAQCLDYRRLGKQRIEVLQILRTITGNSAGWSHHPAVMMWRGYEDELRAYGVAMCDEWIRRGYKDTTREKFLLPPFPAPRWRRPRWVTNQLIRSHRSNLVRKDPRHYGKLWPTVPPDIEYVWPSRLTT